VVTFALAVKVTTVRPKNPLYLGRVVCHLVAKRDTLFTVGYQIDRHFANYIA
jgi:hypothetical protein